MSETTRHPDAGEYGIIIEGLTKRYEDVVAVQNLDLRVRRGELFIFLGPNGAGKTTTMKVLAGLIRPTEGRAWVAGYDIQRDPVEAKRRTGFIPDHPYLYEKLTGADFFRFVGDLFSIPRPIQEQRMAHYFRLFGLESAADKLIENYSHGMRQKLVVSVALMHDPEVVIVDEPLVGLDPKSSRILKDLMREQARAGKTIFLSLHQLAVAEELADRIGIIHRGQLLFVGTIEELRARQQSSQADLEDLFLQLTAEEEPAVGSQLED
ncbi:MAG: ABC transporter ATP-binding protein [Candidatus Sumerlaea chitinivorans]|uniref:ABC transporter, ATP-binding protein n=1 Tax=Sumerlaea chitinivorans TaxID=2250252 RepID=A0A2Z4Y889_SUMC1|nr:ABC transporter, ATP-binding protein [Candidatus Sumerlaea chitinivorans]MCX7964305.1 ABC transporter ATP-binding protein [Candidatus Sumerlaea chitinivorans]